jgi:chromosomal replication initiation ATPase DnaA
MSRIKFNQLADDVAKSFGTDRDLIFKRSKKPAITQPRHILWLLADRHAIRPCSSWLFTSENGLEVSPSTIIRGIDRAEELIRFDKELNQIVKQLS